MPCLAKRGRGGSAQGEGGRGKQDKHPVLVERNTCPVGLVPSGLVSENPVLCPTASPASACCFPAKAMGPRTLLILLVVTAWHGKSRTKPWGVWGGDRVVTGFQGKDSLNLLRDVYRGFLQPAALWRRLTSTRTLFDFSFYYRGVRSLLGHLLDFRGGHGSKGKCQ